MKPIQRLSPAKINLFLHITGRRADGYHNLQSVFRLLDWGDQMQFLPKADQINCTDLQAWHALPNPIQQKNWLVQYAIDLIGADHLTHHLADNLIISAVYQLLNHFLTQNPNANPINTQQNAICLPKIAIHLQKNIPTGAGLGGGSSNAGTTLLVLNQLWQFNFDRKTLIQIGAKVGADVPIFIFGQDAIAEGIGDRLVGIDLPTQRFLLLMPSIHISTKTLFGHIDLVRDKPSLPLDQIRQDYDRFGMDLRSPYDNAFEAVVAQLSPQVAQALDYLRHFEPKTHSRARLTGSGGCVFLPLPETMDLDEVQIWADNAPCPAQIVATLN